jgi:hypothetical protein
VYIATYDEQVIPFPSPAPAPVPVPAPAPVVMHETERPGMHNGFQGGLGLMRTGRPKAPSPGFPMAGPSVPSSAGPRHPSSCARSPSMSSSPTDQRSG